MTPLIWMLVALFALWMAACALCGFRARPLRFLLILAVGLAGNMIWMVLGLDARPFEPHAILAQASATLYALCAFGIGWLVRRVMRAWQAGRITKGEV